LRIIILCLYGHPGFSIFDNHGYADAVKHD
jgi:hypothetical protein